MAKNVAVLRDGIVVNVVKVSDGWTGASGEWQPPKGHSAELNSRAMMGDYRVGDKIKRQVVWNDALGNTVPEFEIEIDNPPDEVLPPPPTPRPPTLRDELVALQIEVEELKKGNIT